jgi:hypothetical protein
MDDWHPASLGSTQQGRLGTYVQPAATIRPRTARSAHARVFGLGAERAAARGCIILDDSGSEENRAAGGPGPEPPILSGRGAPIGMAELQGYMVQGYMPWTSMEPGPSGGVMNRLRCGRSSDSDSTASQQESTHRWTGTTWQAASLDCSEWSEERGVGLGRRRRLADRATWPSRMTIQDVPLEVGHDDTISANRQR